MHQDLPQKLRSTRQALSIGPLHLVLTSLVFTLPNLRFFVAFALWEGSVAKVYVMIVVRSGGLSVVTVIALSLLLVLLHHLLR